MEPYAGLLGEIDMLLVMTVEPGAVCDTGDPVRAIGAPRAKAEHATAQAAWARPEWPPTDL